MATFFTVQDWHINLQSPRQCVELFGSMLRADARKIKLPTTRINITSEINVPDGGIDASVEGELSEKGDLIVDPHTFYQIKAGDTFKPWQESEIRRELLGTNAPKVENLGKHVKHCFEKGGTYVLVCMQIQITPEQKKHAEENLRKILNDCGIRNPSVEVWGQDKILGCLEVFPALSLCVTGRTASTFQTHCDWGVDEEMCKLLVSGDKQEEFINAIRTALHDDSQSIHINVHGEVGVGKTRLVFEATREPSLSPLVIYLRSPRGFLDSQLMTEIVRGEDLHVILVIDECDWENRREIWRRLQNLGSRIKLVTIHNDYVKTRDTTRQIEAPVLDDDKIQQIIQQYGNDDILAKQLSSICGGIPRLAHLFGWDVKNNPSEILKNPTDHHYDIFARYITQGEDPNSESVKQRRWILLTAAMFRKFGFGSHFRDEMDAIHQLVQSTDPQITLPVLREHVDQLKKWKVLQGEDTLYVSPKALHLWLWMVWWEKLGKDKDIEKLVGGLPNTLRMWFFEMFEYAAHSDVAKGVVQSLVSEGGQLHDSDMLKTGLGSDLFRFLAMTDPALAAAHLEKAMGEWSQSELRGFVAGRRSMITGLEHIVFEPDLFTKGGRLLRRLAENENEAWSNNATGIFCGMFSLGPGYVSATKAPPSMRIPLLEETLCAQSEVRRSLGLKACSVALESVNFSRFSSVSSDELRADQKGWEPKTSKEWQEAYQEVIELLCEKVKTFPETDQKKGAEIVLTSSRGLLDSLPDISEYLIGKLSELRDFIGDETLLQETTAIMAFSKDRLSPEAIARLEDLQSQITGDGYPALMSRYVKMDIMTYLADKNNADPREEEIKELAKESLDVDKLRSQLDWLVTDAAKHGQEFGYELSSLDESRRLLPTILDAQRESGESGNGVFLSGYLLKIREADKNRWNAIMREISDDKKLLRFFVELAWRSGITDDIGTLLSELIKKNQLPISALHTFALSRVINKLSTGIVLRWIELLIQSKEQDAIFSTLMMFHSFFIHRQEKPLDAELSLRLLSHSAFFGKERPPSFGIVVDHFWKETAEEMIKQHPDKSLALCKTMLENMGSGPGSIATTGSQAMEVLDKIALKHPNETWDLAARYIDLPFDERGFAIMNWMRGGMFKTPGSFLESVDFDRISDWIDHDPHKRAPYMARHVPPVLRKDNCVTRELLKKYGDDESVQRNLLANFSTEAFSGPASQHHQTTKEKMLAYKESEDDENVKNWIDVYVRALDGDIKREKLREEREF